MPTMYDLLAFFIDKHGGDIKPMQTRDPDVLRRPQHPYELGLSKLLSSQRQDIQPSVLI